MMFRALICAVVLSGAADALAPNQVEDLRFQAPAAWRKTQERGHPAGEAGAGTTRFAAPSGEAYFELDTSQVARPGGIEPSECLEKILQGIGGEGWKRLSVDAAPAAVRADLDTDAKGQKFVTHTYVGCNGKTTWSISFHWVAAKAARFEPLARKIAFSVRYAKRR